MVSDRSKVDISNVEPTVFWVVALKSEAKPIISHFKLDHQSGNSIFPIYRNDKLGHSLIVSGVGRLTQRQQPLIWLVKVTLLPGLRG